VDWQAYDSLSLALQRALLRVAAYRLKPDLRDISFDQVERGRTFLNSGQNGARASLCADLELIHLGEQVVLREVGAEVSFPELPQLHGDAALRLDPPQEVDLDSGWRLAVVFKRLDQDSRATAMRGAGDRREAAFDRERIAWPIALRPPSPGDRIQPLGMSGSLKVANLFVNEKIPWPARARWPIIADQAQVLWVSSLRMAHSARLTQGTHEALVMRLIPPEPPFQR
jgi:tRNA(Ile)-lysidine synthetase-like protein